jgi:hypothetical protein
MSEECNETMVGETRKTPITSTDSYLTKGGGGRGPQAARQAISAQDPDLWLGTVTGCCWYLPAPAHLEGGGTWHTRDSWFSFIKNEAGKGKQDCAIPDLFHISVWVSALSLWTPSTFVTPHRGQSRNILLALGTVFHFYSGVRCLQGQHQKWNR